MTSSKRAVATVAEQAIAGGGRSRIRIGGKRSALDQINIEPAIVVEVEQADAAAGRDRRDELPGSSTVFLHKIEPCDSMRHR